MTLLLPSAASISCGGNQQTGDFNHKREGLSQWKGENETICGVEALAKRHFRTLSLHYDLGGGGVSGGAGWCLAKQQQEELPLFQLLECGCL